MKVDKIIMMFFVIICLFIFCNCKNDISISFINKTEQTLDTLCIDGNCFVNVKENSVMICSYDSALFDSGIYAGKALCRMGNKVLTTDSFLYCGSSLNYRTAGNYTQTIVICRSESGEHLCFDGTGY